MENKKYIIGFDTRCGTIILHGEYNEGKEIETEIETLIALNYGNKYCYIIVSEIAYENIMLAYDKSVKISQLRNNLFIIKSNVENAIIKLNEIRDENKL